MNSPPTRSVALARLEAFVPLAAKYAGHRNFDLGVGKHTGVSSLSPYIRTRLVTDEEATRAVLARHSPSAAEKFLQEIAWRTYWKGWLEMRPEAWSHYLATLAEQEKSAAYGNAIAGETGIGCFDHWVRELLDTGYLHNHARMWFASIWIFTLKLPWQLGADFFLCHLLDGDPAANTLSWRWVAGLHTPGKHYLARAENIEKFTLGRFDPAGQLDEKAQAIPLDQIFTRQALHLPQNPKPTHLRPVTPATNSPDSPWSCLSFASSRLCVNEPPQIGSPINRVAPLRNRVFRKRQLTHSRAFD
jgi:deoxyribodipyrimidine photo-lyase